MKFQPILRFYKKVIFYTVIISVDFSRRAHAHAPLYSRFQETIYLISI